MNTRWIACVRSHRSAAVPLLAALLLLPGSSAEAAELRAENDVYAVSVAELRPEALTHLRHASRFDVVLEVVDRRTGERFERLVRGVAEEPIGLYVVRDRLATVGRRYLTVTDLRGGDELYRARTVDATASPDGRRIAFKAFHGRWAPVESLSSIVLVLDVADMMVRPVYPEMERIRYDGRGTPTAPVEARGHVEHVGRLFWSPDGAQLLFLVQRGVYGGSAGESAYTVVRADVGSGPMPPHTVRRPLDLARIVDPDADVAGRPNLVDIESVRWLGAGRVELVPPADYWWLPEPVTLELR